MKADALDWLARRLVVLDFETYYAPDYTLSKMTTADYIRDPRFETIGVGVLAPGASEVRWMEHAEFLDFGRGWDWKNSLALAHHAHFDGFILSHHYDIRPGYWLDTLSMGRARHGVEVGGSLGKLMKHYNVGTKGDEVVKALGKRRKDFTMEEWLRYGEYCKGDVLGTLGVFVRMLEQEFPDSELDHIDTTVRMFTEPVLRLNEPAMGQYLVEERARKAKLVEATDSVRADLMSNDKFAVKLLELGVVPPMKVSPRTGEEAFAFAKSDPGMQALLEHEDDDVRALAEARIAVKSTINETRTERLLRLGKAGASLPVYLKYSGAHTHRWSGGDRLNWQNFQRGGKIRDAIEAPDGCVLDVVDSSQIEARMVAWLAEHFGLLDAFAEGRDIYSEFASGVYGRPVDRKRVEVVDGKETKPDFIPGFVGKVCLAGETPVLTRRGWVPLHTVDVADEVWDGMEWVRHSGLIDQGVREVWESRGVAATPDHEILTAHGWQAWSEVLTNHSLFQSALSSATLPFSDGSTVLDSARPRGGNPLSAASAVGKAELTDTISLPDDRLAATPARRSPRQPSGTGNTSTRSTTTRIAPGSSTASRPALGDATTPRTGASSTTEDEESSCTKDGALTGPSFSDSSRQSLDGINPNSSSTASTPTAPTPPEMSVSSPSPRISETSAGSRISRRYARTYDLASCGPRSRFVIWSEGGPLVVHNCILGLGYGMGWLKFAATMQAGAMGGPRVTFTAQDAANMGVTVERFASDSAKRARVESMPSLLPMEERLAHCAVAEFIVQRYRREHAPIPALWREMEQVIVGMSHEDADYPISRGNMRIIRHGLVLPNGLVLKYAGLEGDPEDGWSYLAPGYGKQRSRLYGGLMTENVVQALARIVVADQMQRLREEFGYRPCMMTHDEVVLCVPKAEGEKALERALAVFRTPPAWAPDLPLDAEGGISKSYGEAK